MENKIYCGSVKTVSTKYGDIYKISFNKDDLKKLHDALNSKGWVNLDMVKRKTQGFFGDTHSLSIDNWKPKNEMNVGPKEQKHINDPYEKSKDLPF